MLRQEVCTNKIRDNLKEIETVIYYYDHCTTRDRCFPNFGVTTPDTYTNCSASNTSKRLLAPSTPYWHKPIPIVQLQFTFPSFSCSLPPNYISHQNSFYFCQVFFDLITNLTGSIMIGCSTTYIAPSSPLRASGLLPPASRPLRCWCHLLLPWD